MNRTPRDIAEIGGGGQRGRCPRCGRGDVFHVVVGMPAGPEVLDEAPEWTELAGCVVDEPMTNRRCDSCGLVWRTTPNGVGVELRDWAELKRLLGTPTDQDFAEWIDIVMELDFDVEDFPDDHDPDGVLTRESAPVG